MAFHMDGVLNFMTAVMIHSDFGTRENKVCPCFLSSLLSIEENRLSFKELHKAELL